MVAWMWLLAGVVSIPLFVFAAETAAGLAGADRRSPAAPDAPPYAVLIPAHDEEAGIARLVTAVLAQLRPCDQVLVIADNCTDATAQVARQAGATVRVRTDADRNGKAYALAFGRDCLAAAPPAVVIVLDADCVPEPGSLARLATTAIKSNAAVQARNLLSTAGRATPLVQISSFAFLIKNLVRQRGLQRLSGIALLQGNGMAFPWPMFADAPLATASLVEDMRLGLELALAGQATRFDDDAHVFSPPASQNATRSQRTRWEHGTLATAVEYVPRLLGAGLLGRPRLLLLAADLLIPPLALLVVLTGAAFAVLGMGVLMTGAVAPLAFLAGALTLFALAIIASWMMHGRAMLPASTLLRVPHYVLWKQPIYARVAARRQRSWIRTSRQP